MNGFNFLSVVILSRSLRAPYSGRLLPCAMTQIGHDYIALRYNHFHGDKGHDRRLPRAGRAALLHSPFSPRRRRRGTPRRTVQALAERLLLKHNSTVELIDRLETGGYACRIRSRQDRRRVLVKLLPQGEKLAERVARERLSELHTRGEALAKALDTLLGRKPKSRTVKKNARHSPTKRRKRKS